ncbi:3-hydroxyacyl-CoA dehydrogenase [Clostridiales bacterium PH28_bin88]|nr:3-hydroxyacyl-CoA dehydrogenase [Clostridiales bacterium PH28_bin88]
MRRDISKAMVLGSGVMGSTIAAHLANVGIPTYLLDIVPGELTEEEKWKGLTLENPVVRNRLAARGKEGALKARPAAFYVPENADLVSVGNLEDNLSWASEVDWIIEVVVERLDVKRDLFQKLEAYRRPGTIVSSNTSGISINAMAEGRSEDFRRHFLGTHFFNPPRYMRLLEVIPGRDTLPEVVEFMMGFGHRVLGKGVVLAKDTPNFVANRIGVYGMVATINAMVEDGLTVEQVDAITGPAMGRPKSATYRTADLVGLDTFMHVARNVRDSLADPGEKREFLTPEFLEEMLKNRWLGDKSGQGFYKKVKSEQGKEVLSLDYRTLEYRPQQKAKFPSLEAAKAVEDLPKRLKGLVYAQDPAGKFAWKIMKKTLLYSAARVPEIADDIVNIDRGMKWGFNWELGPFEAWDAIGVEESVARMRQEGETIPPLVEKLLAKGYKSFYRKEGGKTWYFDQESGEYQALSHVPDVIFLPDLKEQRRVVKSNAGASLVDLGDGVACLEFHSKSNAIGSDIVEMIRYSVEEVSKNFAGLVLGNHGKNFSVGANLVLILLEAQDDNWEDLDMMVRQFQGAAMALKHCPKPVVAAPFQMALGGGCEMVLAAHRVQASAETYMGLVEVGVGLLPAGGGTKEMLLRAMERIPSQPGSQVPLNIDPTSFVARAFENIATAKVSTSGPDAQRLGYLRTTDGITINPDRVIYEAKQAVLAIAREGFKPPQPAKVRVLGRQGYAGLDLMVYTLHQGGYISDYDAHIARKIARVLSGGDVSPGTVVTEQYILDLERENFLSLLGELRTQQRIQHMLATGKPLRN